MSEHVVAPALFLIAQVLVGLVDLLEFLFGLFLFTLAGLQVRVVLAGHLAIGLLEVVVGDVPVDAECFVIVAFGHGDVRR